MLFRDGFVILSAYGGAAGGVMRAGAVCAVCLRVAFPPAFAWT